MEGPPQKKTRQLVGVPYILAQSGEGVSRPLCLCSCWSLALALLPKDIHSGYWGVGPTCTIKG